MEKAAGFTLIEVLVAIAIAASALLVMMGRLGASADVQHTLQVHELMLETALDVLERGKLEKQGGTFRETHGERKVGNLEISWKSSYLPTVQQKLLRQNVEVSAPGEASLTLSRYRSVP